MEGSEQRERERERENMKYLFFIDRHDLNISRHFWPIYMETGEWRHSDWSHRQPGHWTDREQRDVCLLRWYFPQWGDIVVVLLCWATLLGVGVESDWPECQHTVYHVTQQKLRAMTCCGSRPSDWTPARSREGGVSSTRGILLTVLWTSLSLSLSLSG